MKELKGGEPHVHQQPHGIDGGDFRAGSAQAALQVDMHIDSRTCATASPSTSTTGRRNGWRTAAKEPVKNQDLWQRLDAARNRHTVRWHWVKGHSGDLYNDRADELVREARDEMRSGR